MATIHRYSKPTIRGQVWESSIVENEGNIVLHETQGVGGGLDRTYVGATPTPTAN